MKSSFPIWGDIVWIDLNTSLGHVQRGRRQASKEKIGAAVYDYFQSNVSGLPTVWWTPLLEKLGAYVKATSYLMKDQTISLLQCSRSRTLQLIAPPPQMIQNANLQCSIIAKLGIFKFRAFLYASSIQRKCLTSHYRRKKWNHLKNQKIYMPALAWLGLHTFGH